MGEFYLLGMRQAAWLSTTGQYSTDRTVARRYSYDEAMSIARRHKEASNTLVPVPCQMMDAI